MGNGTAVGYALGPSLLISGVVGLIIACITLGNLLVIVAVVKDRKLKSMLQNWLIVSLAVADLLVGLLIMPLTLTYELVGEWVLGRWLCELWLALDVLFVTASILNLCTISLDRYWSVTDPLQYPAKRSPKRMLGMITVCWLASIAISLPPVLGWRPKRKHMQCNLSEDLGYVLYSGLGSFWVPTTVLIGVYIRIYRISRKRSKRKIKEIEGSLASSQGRCVTAQQTGYARVALESSEEEPSSSGYHSPKSTSVHTNLKIAAAPPPAINHSVSVQANTDHQAESSLMIPVTKSLCNLQLTTTRMGRHLSCNNIAINDRLAVKRVRERGPLGADATGRFETSRTRSECDGVPTQLGAPESSGGFRSFFRLPSPCLGRSPDPRKAMLLSPGHKNALNRKRLLKKRERRGTLILGFIMASFVACWLPFFVLYLLGTTQLALPSQLFKVFFWLGYCNSAFNPIIYGVFNPEFKRAFIKILKFKM